MENIQYNVFFSIEQHLGFDTNIYKIYYFGRCSLQKLADTYVYGRYKFDDPNFKRSSCAYSAHGDWIEQNIFNFCYTLICRKSCLDIYFISFRISCCLTLCINCYYLVTDYSSDISPFMVRSYQNERICYADQRSRLKLRSVVLRVNNNETLFRNG